MDIVRSIRTYVEEECKKPESHYGYEPFPCHFVPMVHRAKTLAEHLGGDQEVIEISGWLHDLGSIVYGREDHHITGAKLAEEKLQSLGYPAPKIALVKNCILHHRGSIASPRHSIEEQIIAEADVMSCFDNIAGLFSAALIYEKLSQEEARLSVREKFQRKREQLHFEASQKMIRPKYEAAMLLLS